MAKEVAVLKRAKISKAQQNVLLAVLGASLFLGAAVSLGKHFVEKIAFNIDVIAEEERAIASYSDAIKNYGVCRAPAGAVYTDAELAACNPDDIDISSIPGTLRANIMEAMAANKALGSVQKEDDANCTNPKTKKAYTYKEMQDLYNDASDTDARKAASRLIMNCSALRVIPDALPATKNEEALLASLNKIFIVSGWLPESISPTGEQGNIGGDSEEGESSSTSLDTIAVSINIEGDSAVTMSFLENLDRSIRNFYITNMTVKWDQGGLEFSSRAAAFFMTKTSIQETQKSIKPENAKASNTSTTTGGEQ